MHCVHRMDDIIRGRTSKCHKKIIKKTLDSHIGLCYDADTERNPPTALQKPKGWMPHDDEVCVPISNPEEDGPLNK